MAGKRGAKARTTPAKKAKTKEVDDSSGSDSDSSPNVHVEDEPKVTMGKKDLEAFVQSMIAQQQPAPVLPKEATKPIVVPRGALGEHGEPHVVKKRGKPGYTLTTRSSKWMIARSELQSALDTYKMRVSFLDKSEKEADEQGTTKKNKKGYKLFCKFGFGSDEGAVFEHTLVVPQETAKHAFGETFYTTAKTIAETYGFDVSDLLNGTFQKD